MSEKPHYRQRGGYWLNGIGGFTSWPFGHIAVFPDRLEVNHARYGRHEIVRLRRRQGFLCSGLEITHNKQHDPQVVVFWPLNFAPLQTALQQCGYNVET